jgi:hypothetical protein
MEPTPFDKEATRWPGDSYQPDPDATELVRKYSENPKHFRLNEYATFDDLPHPMPNPFIGEYKTLWVPELAHGTRRYCYPFQCKSLESPIVAEHAACPACKAMVVRLILLVDKFKRIAEWDRNGRSKREDGIEQLAFVVGKISGKLLNANLPDGLRLVINPVTARNWAALHPSKDTNHPNHKYGVAAAVIAGVPLVVENSVSVKSVTHEGGEDRHYYVWPSDLAVLLYHSPTNPGRATVRYRFTDRMTVETHAANLQGRIVEDFELVEPNPEFAFALTW